MNTHTISKDSIRVLNASSIKSLIPMERAIELMGSAFKILSDKSAFVPPRVVMTSQDESMSVFFKPAFVQDYNRMSIKILTQIHNNEPSDNATIKGMILLVDLKTGSALSLSDGTYATALRTGAASGIATQYLANQDAATVAVFGCGAQGRTQLEAIMAVRPIQSILLFDSSTIQAERLVANMALNPDIDCQINPDLEELKTADIICTATPSKRPLFMKSQIKTGVHINAIGSYRPDMQELDPEILGMGKIYLDHSVACLSDSGDLLIPLNQGIIGKNDITGELGELIGGLIPGRQNHDEITIFKSVGSAIQDFFIANEAYEMAQGFNDSNWINFTE